jgi:tripartite-type tricarboxylate transporter receptor subunit TctC
MRLDEMRIFLAILPGAASAHAQEYPAKPIRFIVATAPGGLMDMPARLLAKTAGLKPE